MPRLIEVQDVRACPSPMTVKMGDVLLFHAVGGHVRSGNDVIKLMGPFVPAVVGDEGDILTPMGPPNTIFFCALQPGHAMIEMVTGDPFHLTEKKVLHITVES